MRSNTLGIVSASVLALAVTAGGAMAAETSSSPAVYTAAQATAGAKVFSGQCASCHGDDLQGKVGPALKGIKFDQMTKSQNMNAAGLYKFISEHMPLTAPGSLTKTQYEDVMSYILQENGFPAGSTELTPDEDSLKGITFKKSS